MVVDFFWMNLYTLVFQIPPEVNGVLGMFLGSKPPHQVFGSLGIVGLMVDTSHLQVIGLDRAKNPDSIRTPGSYP